MKKLLATAALIASASMAHAATVDFTVDAINASYDAGKGSGLDTGIDLASGQAFSVSTDLRDTWILGRGVERIGNADGLSAFRNYRTKDGDFAFGTLVGRIGSGNFFRIGSSFDGVANASGTLTLFNWDSNTWDNSGDIVASVSVPTSPVPLPASGLLLLGGFGALGAMRRSRRRS